MKTSSIFSAILLLLASHTLFAQQADLMADSRTATPDRGATYGAHGPLYNGTLNDPTIAPRKAVPVGSLKGKKRELTNQVIEGNESADSPEYLMAGDDMQRVHNMRPMFGKKPAAKKTKSQQQPTAPEPDPARTLAPSL